MRLLLARLNADRRGVAAVEFALIAPVLVTLMLGTFEMTQLAIAYMKVASAAETVADLITQQKQVSSADIHDYFDAGELVLTPLPAASLKAQIVSITYDAGGTPQLGWQDPQNGAAAIDTTNAADVSAALSQLLNGNTLGGPGESVVAVQATYSYVSPISYFVTGAITLSQTAYSRPRLTAAVSHL
jgi:Flp pilus assembly protein TadG